MHGLIGCQRRRGRNKPIHTYENTQMNKTEMTALLYALLVLSTDRYIQVRSPTTMHHSSACVFLICWCILSFGAHTHAVPHLSSIQICQYDTNNTQHTVTIYKLKIKTMQADCPTELRGAVAALLYAIPERR